MKYVGIYVASKTKHAGIWRSLRDSGYPIISSWIDEAEEGQTASYGELAERCIREVASSTDLILYCDESDILKGALIEVGAALSCGIPVYCIGDCDSLSRVFCCHPMWIKCGSIEEALWKAVGR